MKCPKPECACGDVQGVLEFGKEVVLSSSHRFLFAKLLLFTCLGRGKRVCVCFKNSSQMLFPFILLLLPVFCFLPLEPFDLKTFVVFTSCKSFSHNLLGFLFPSLSFLLNYIISLTRLLFDKEKWKICKTFCKFVLSHARVCSRLPFN